MDRQTICRKALELFSRDGYENVTVQDICDSCDITKPTFYRHISSKEEIIIEIYDDMTRDLAEKLLGMIDAEDHWSQLLLCFDTLVDESSRLGPDLLSRVLIINLENNRHTLDMRQHLTDVMIRIVELGQRSGQIGNPAPAEELYRAAAHLFSGYELMWCINKGDFDWKVELQQDLELLFQPEDASHEGVETEG